MAYSQHGSLMNRYPIYVISKGRSGRCITARELCKMGVRFSLVVEPQEFDAYNEVWGDTCEIITTPFSNLGNGSIDVRNFVFGLSVSNGDKRHWILDDNIEAFNRLNRNEKYRVKDGTIFRCCEDFSDRYDNIALSGMNYASFCKAWDAVPPYYLNTRIYSCILVNNAIEQRWRGKYNEDTDLSLRVLKSGMCTVLFNAFLCGKVTTQRMSGGNTKEVYGDTDNRREFAESLREQHPDCVKVVWKFGRWHHSVNYKPFRSNQLNPIVDLSGFDKVDNYGMRLSSGERDA